MSARLIAAAALGVVLFTDIGLAETPLKSGPQVGDRNNKRGFMPQWVTGPAAGQRRCPV
jgi:hypothetical protein